MSELTKTHFRKFFKSSSLNDSHFNVSADTVVKIIRHQVVTLETANGKDPYPCVILEGYDLPLRLNSGMHKCCAKACGSKFIEDWAGKFISIWVEKGVRAFGDVHDVPRVRPVAPRISPVATVDQVAQVVVSLKIAGEDLSEYCKKAGLKDIKEIRQDKAMAVINHVKKMNSGGK